VSAFPSANQRNSAEYNALVRSQNRLNKYTRQHVPQTASLRTTTSLHQAHTSAALCCLQKQINKTQPDSIPTDCWEILNDIMWTTLKWMTHH